MQTYSLTYGADETLFFGRKNTPHLDARIEFNKNAYSFILYPTSDNKLFVYDEKAYFYMTYYRTSSGSDWTSRQIGSNIKEAQIKNVFLNERIK